MCLAAAAACRAQDAAVATRTEASAQARAEPSAEALLARGMSQLEERRLSDGLDAIERAVMLRPQWEDARRTLAYALVRAGEFERAGQLIELLMGTAVARALSSGELTGRDLPAPVEPEDVLALAIVRAETGAWREADLLYRSHADLVGPSTPEAARAFRRLADLYEEPGAEWGSAEVELRRARALDPEIESRSTLPEFPDPERIEELEPYLSQPYPAPGRDAPPEGYDSLPWISGWTPHEASGSMTPLTKDVIVEVLVGEDGSIVETALPEDVSGNPAQSAAADRTVRAWSFEPAVSAGAPVEAWVAMEIEIPLLPTEQDTTGAEQDTTGVEQDTTRTEQDTARTEQDTARMEQDTTRTEQGDSVMERETESGPPQNVTETEGEG